MRKATNDSTSSTPQYSGAQYRFICQTAAQNSGGSTARRTLRPSWIFVTAVLASATPIAGSHLKIYDSGVSGVFLTSYLSTLTCFLATSCIMCKLFFKSPWNFCTSNIIWGFQQIREKIDETWPICCDISISAILLKFPKTHQTFDKYETLPKITDVDGAVQKHVKPEDIEQRNKIRLTIRSR